MSQTTYPLQQTNGIAGQLADTGPNDIRTYNNPAAIEFGRALGKISADDDGVKHPTLTGDSIVGVAHRKVDTVADNYPANSAVGAIKMGRVFVKVEEAVTPDDDVFVRYDGKVQVQTFVLDADLVTGNVITVDVDGVTVSHTFATDHDTSLAAFAAKIQLEPGVNTAVAAARTITITAASRETDVALTNEGITGGASQAGIVITETIASISDNDRGLFRNNADSTTAVALTGARFLTAAAAGELAVLDLNLT